MLFSHLLFACLESCKYRRPQTDCPILYVVGRECMCGQNKDKYSSFLILGLISQSHIRFNHVALDGAAHFTSQPLGLWEPQLSGSSNETLQTW